MGITNSVKKKPALVPMARVISKGMEGYQDRLDHAAILEDAARWTRCDEGSMRSASS
jgi:hypothetical protein